ncbi:MAG: hypothetical protein JW791_04790 [Nanoarchaeota archaeon]|nr:hypothetical protein [Nanoarchaeota archaeon]
MIPNFDLMISALVSILAFIFFRNGATALDKQSFSHNFVIPFVMSSLVFIIILNNNFITEPFQELISKAGELFNNLQSIKLSNPVMPSPTIMSKLMLFSPLILILIVLLLCSL